MHVHRPLVASAVTIVLAASFICAGGAQSTSNPAASVAAHSVNPDPTLAAALRQRLGLSSLTTQALEFESTADGSSVTTSIIVGGAPWTIELRKHTVRSDGFRVLVQSEPGGALHPAAAPPIITYRGTVLERPDARVRATYANGRLTAAIYATEDVLGVESLAALGVSHSPADHVVYAESDRLARRPYRCGSAEYRGPRFPRLQSVGGAEGAPTGTGMRIADIALDSDFEYFEGNGSDVGTAVQDMETVINTLEPLYEVSPLNLTYEFTTAIVRTVPGAPYTATDINTLLNQMLDTWESDPELAIQRDLQHLLTGKNFGLQIGLAFSNNVCSTAANGLSTTFFAQDILSRATLTAHELGHTWTAPHCNAEPECRIMCTPMGNCDGLDPLQFGPSSVASMVPYISTRPCVGSVLPPATLPFFDGFESQGPDPDASAWSYNNGVLLSSAAVNEPSGSGSANLNAAGPGDYRDDDLRSNFIPLSAEPSARLSYFTQHRGVEAGEELVVEYWESGLHWIELNRVVSDGTAQDTFQFHTHDLPPAALHDEFRVRFRAEVNAADDDWFLDDVLVVSTACEVPCTDDNVCTINDTCSGNECVGVAPDCSMFEDPCFTAGCDPNGAVGNCDALTPRADCSGAGDACNSAECDPGGTAGNCDVLIPINAGGPCEDGGACTVGDLCDTLGGCIAGSAPDCTPASDDCSTATCDPGGAAGNCDTLTPINEGGECRGGPWLCNQGVCQVRRVYMAVDGQELTVAASGNTSLIVAPGSAMPVVVWIEDTVRSAALSLYQVVVRWDATVVGQATGTVAYVDNDPGATGGDSVFIDEGRADYVFANDVTIVPEYGEAAPPPSETAGFRFVGGLGQLPAGTLVDGIRYLGEFEIAASVDACGEHEISFVPFGGQPDAGTNLNDSVGGAFVVDEIQNLSVQIGILNDNCPNAAVVSDGLHPINTNCTTTDGPAHPSGCSPVAGTAIAQDIWFKYTAICTGSLTVSTCDDADYDTRVAVYQGGVGCVPLDGDLLGCNDDATGCGGATSELQVNVGGGGEYLIRVGGAPGSSGTGHLTLTCDGIAACPVGTADQCCDRDGNGVRDDVCNWCACEAPVCNNSPKLVPADLGGAFGSCAIDGFCNVHDRNHALSCFSGTSACDGINVDAGGAFGACAPDGFCNVHDANHALTCFSGTNACLCSGGPAPEYGPRVVGDAGLTLVPSRRIARPGDTVQVRVFIDAPLKTLQSYQLHVGTSGGRNGQFELIDIAIEERQDFVYADAADSFVAFNVDKSQVLAGIDGSGVATTDRAYLATYTYGISRNAAGTFVVDLLHAEAEHHQTFLIGAEPTDKIEVNRTTPAVITVVSATPETSPAARD